MNKLTFGSVCSGIEAASVAWEPLGLGAAWLSEIEPFPCAVLSHRWPNTVNIGDMYNVRSAVRAGVLAAPDVLIGGTPCQSFSIAGLRKGLDDERGQLTLEYVRIANEIDEQRPNREAVTLWENVPGVLTSKDNAFGCFLGALCGETSPLEPAGRKWSNVGAVFGPQRAIAWRVLDAQYFGVAQRRRRLFVVSSARAGFDPTKVLFESEGVRGDHPPSSGSKSGSSARTSEGFTSSNFGGYKRGVGTLRAHGGDLGGGSETLVVQTVGALDTQCGAGKMTQQTVNSGHIVLGAVNGAGSKGLMGTLTARGLNALGARDIEEGAILLDTARPVPRKLMPLECERLQGFVDGYTCVPFRGRGVDKCPDGPRYKALGNSMPVPVIRWLGKRIINEIRRCEHG